MIGEYLPKVTAFITRPGLGGRELLLFQHPTAGIQIPAGTVDEGETSEQAVLREAAEETGLENLRLTALIGQRDELPPGSTHVMLYTSQVFTHPNHPGVNRIELRRGIAVRLLRLQDGFAQVTYTEGDRFPDPHYISFQVTGWVPEETLAHTNRRTFYHLELVGDALDAWEHFSDSHLFRLFWAPLRDLPDIVAPQMEWVNFAMKGLG